MTGTDPIAAVLLDARARLASGKWCKRQEFDSNGNMCMQGALMAARNGIEADVDIYKIERLLGKHMWCSSIPGFNDASETTLADVLTVFDKALAELGAPDRVTP
jgi:hypothetical protein